MIQLHLNTEDFTLAQEAGFRNHMQPSENNGAALSSTPWLWYGFRKSIFNREVWVFIEAETQFCVCFFDLKLRDLRQLDLTLWLRFISEHHFMIEKSYAGPKLPIDETFLTVIRSWMAPMNLHISTSSKISILANNIFTRIKSFMRRPLPCPIPLRYEMEFTWGLNIAYHPSLHNDKVVDSPALIDLAKQTQADIIDFPIEGVDLDSLQLDEFAIMEIIHKQLKSGAMNSLSPALHFTTKVASMMIPPKESWGHIIPFKPKVTT